MMTVSKEKEKEVKAKWIYNISSKSLNEPQTNVLQRSLAFNPSQSAPDYVDFVVAIESGARLFGHETAEAASLRSNGTRLMRQFRPAPPNVTPEERRVIKDIRDDDSISVHPADKGRATVVMDKADYHQKMESLFSDEATYTRLTEDPTQDYRNAILEKLRPMQSYLPSSIYYRLFPTTTNPPLAFGQPKVHKTGYPLRPIVSARNTIFSGITKELARLLQPLVGHTSHHLRDSVDLVEKLKRVTIPPNYSLVSFDLISMFTTIPQEPTIAIVQDKLRNDAELKKRIPITVDDIVALLKLDLDLAYFRWNGDFFAQTAGLGMGNSTSSPLSDLFMEDFETKALRDFRTDDPNVRPENVILFWLRKADDTLTAIHNDYIEPLFTHLNAIHPSIKWTMEREVGGRIAMLDVTIIRNDNGALDFDVYRKPTHTNQYIPFDSAQPLSHKLSTIHALTRRAHLIPSTDELRKEEIRRVKEALTINGYPRWAYNVGRYRPKPPPQPPPLPPPPPPRQAIPLHRQNIKPQQPLPQQYQQHLHHQQTRLLQLSAAATSSSLTIQASLSLSPACFAKTASQHLSAPEYAEWNPAKCPIQHSTTHTNVYF